MDKNFAVIMAGGIGSRFWPMSTDDMPKQFLDILGVGKSLLQITVDRLKKICPVENILIVTNKQYKNIVKEQLPNLADEHILLEPQRRNTAPCIAYANYVISKKCNDANIIVAPSDHLILDEAEFVSIVSKGIDFASSNGVLLTLGIKPSRPDTGYGYIQFGEEKGGDFFTVKTFTEKPDLETANFFLSSGEFSWNSGIFIWNLDTINKAFQCHLPDLSRQFEELRSDESKSIEDVYSECINISIDYGIMEKADNVCVIQADFGWSDLGTWGSLYENTKKTTEENSIIEGDVFLYESERNIVRLPKGKTGVICNIDDYIIVDSEHSLLVCPKKEEQRIKQFVNDIKIKKSDISG